MNEKESERAFPIYEPRESPTAQLKVKFRELYDAVMAATPESQARHVALIHLEEAGMWAVKAMHRAGAAT